MGNSITLHNCINVNTAFPVCWMLLISVLLMVSVWSVPLSCLSGTLLIPASIVYDTVSGSRHISSGIHCLFSPLPHLLRSQAQCPLYHLHLKPRRHRRTPPPHPTFSSPSSPLSPPFSQLVSLCAATQPISAHPAGAGSLTRPLWRTWQREILSIQTDTPLSNAEWQGRPGCSFKQNIKILSLSFYEFAWICIHLPCVKAQGQLRLGVKKKGGNK